MEIQHFSHSHALTFRMPSDQEVEDLEGPPVCKGCGSDICGLAYTCEEEDCGFWLHESCSELPEKIEKHPFHSTHSLYLQYFPDHIDNIFICDGCQELCGGFKYFCKWCRFFLDIRCALTYEEAEASKGAQAKITLLHFSHNHQVTRCKMGEKLSFRCDACEEAILGAAYLCMRCIFSLHESCLNDMPQEEVEHPFHPQHHLLPQLVGNKTTPKTCNACYGEIRGINFSCNDCSFYLHASCAKYQTRAMKHQFHEHDLFYFGPKNIGRCRKCHSCGEDCSASFFCCVACDLQIHLECLPLPLMVKHNRHVHPLILKDSVVEDDSGQYYCYICETERNPEHHVYYCEECNYTAHLNCVISQVEPPEEILSYLIPSSKKVEPKQEKIEELSRSTDSKVEEERGTDIFAEKLGLVKPNDEDNDVQDYNAAGKVNNLEAASDPELRDAKQSGKANEECDTEDLAPTKLKEEIEDFQEEVEELTAKLVVVQVKLKKLVDSSSLLPSPKTARKIQHFSHKHALTFFMVNDLRMYWCSGCRFGIRGLAYACEYELCDFHLHKSCCELHREIEKHPLHPAHSLVLIQDDDLDDYLICDGCQEVFRGQKYICRWCRFILDIKCAFITDEEAVALKGHGYVKTTILHFSHEHHLTRCSVIDKLKLRCKGCKEAILGPTYACLGCRFFLHESCFNDMPQEVKTPFHPLHHLLPQPMKYYNSETCNACFEKIWGINFSCDDCSFYLHASCAMYQTRAIKHEFHEHDLLYFGQRNIGRHRKCCFCGKSCKTSFFCCVICQVDIHLECLTLPLTAKHDNHFHPLTLRDSIVEDDLGDQYYCDLCETERNPKHHVYYCEDCNYTAHIDCVISKVKPPEKILSYLIPRSKEVEIQHFSHKHSLTICMLSDQEADDDKVPPQCNGCASYIRGSAYTCEDCNFWLHKSCCELLARTIEKHPFHSAHSLYLDDALEGAFICDGCQELCYGLLKYVCKCCGFCLDIKCGCLTYEEAEASKGTQDKTTIQHFSHYHQLNWCKVKEEMPIGCLACKEVILGAAYICTRCGFIIQEPCFNGIPQEEVEHPFHPQHHLQPQPMADYTLSKTCNACHEEIWGISFNCQDCSFYLHISCAKYQTRAIKHHFHEHDLFYFGPKNIGRCRKCHSCGEDCNASFFCCVVCEVDIHLECLPLPHVVKHKCHLHPLTLIDFVVEDSGKYYCNICETERNPDHHAYYCEMCNYIAHIHCVISQVEPLEEILLYLISRLKKVASEEEKDETKSEIRVAVAEEVSYTEELVCSELEERIKNLQEEEEGLIGSLELVQLKVKNRTQKLLDLMKKESTK